MWPKDLEREALAELFFIGRFIILGLFVDNQLIYL